MNRLAVFFCVWLLSSCAGQSPVVQVEALRRHAPGAAAPGRFVVLPYADQRDSDEFAVYADLIAVELIGLGGRRENQYGPGIDVLRFRWGIDPVQSDVVMSPSALPPVGVPTYRIRRGIGDPFPYWTAQRVTYWPKWLSAVIAQGGDAAAEPVFEGRVVSKRGGAEIGPIMPYLVRAMFLEFPGPNGTNQALAVPVR